MASVSSRLDVRARLRTDRAGLARDAAWLFCLVIGSSLLVDGILGLILSPTSLRTGDSLPHRNFNFAFEFNSWHHVLHIVTAAVLVLGAVRRAWAPAAALAFGLVYVAFALVGFLHGSAVFGVVYSDTRDNVVHATLAIGGVGLWAAVRVLAPR